MSEGVIFDIGMDISTSDRSPHFKYSAAKMFAAFCLIDGSPDDREIKVVQRVCGELSIPIEVFDSALVEAATDPADTFLTALLAVEEVDERELLAAFLYEVASSDSVFHEREAELLDLMREAWGVSVDFLNQPIKWDADQRGVIEAAANEKQIVSAGPGMGKTAVACARVSHLIEQLGCTDSNIWLVSFTRAAVAELKGRIADFAEDPANVFAAKIATIDSQAWKVRYGFSEADAEKLFGGFETGIDAAARLMKERAGDFRDAFSGLEHIIIDEAQDITGARAEFILQLLSLLPTDCGVTIFYDPAQAIYDYALEDGGIRFVEEVQEKTDWKSVGLKKIYRTEDPALLRLYEELRLDILGNTGVDSKSFERRTELVKGAAAKVDKGHFDHKKLPEIANTLVLFRKRVEVVQASAFMAGDGAPHRLRMSGLPRTLHPWIGAAFSGCDARYLDRCGFDERVMRADEAGADLSAANVSDFADENWDTLSRHGLVRRGELDLWAFRDRLHINPPDEFASVELGAAGPILGTIHASKGREADHVVLQINRHWCGEKDQTADHHEEARVLFVGASRARRSLEIQGGLTLPFASSTDDGRCFRRSSRYRNGAQVQIGLKNDYDPYSILQTQQKKFEFCDLLKEKLPLYCSATLEPGTWRFCLVDGQGRRLGWFSQSLNYSLFEVAKRLGDVGRKPKGPLKYLSVLGWTTAVAPTYESERLASIGTNAAKSGFWLAPQIIGFSLVFFSW